MLIFLEQFSYSFTSQFATSQDYEPVLSIMAKHGLSKNPKLTPDLHVLTRFLDTVLIQEYNRGQQCKTLEVA